MIIEQQIVAMRRRDPQNPSDRTQGNKNLEQRLEPNSEGICNTITTVQKANMVMESVKLGNAANCNQRCAVYDENAMCPTIQAAVGEGGNQQPMWCEIKQAIKNGYIKCDIRGGGRFELSKQQNTQRQSSRERSDKPNTNDGEYP